MRKFTNSLFLITVFLVVSSCVTQKKKDDVGALGKGYHNMTAHYNGYYNATVLIAEGKLELENQYKENYRKVLPVYKYLATDNPKAVAESMDKAAEKVSLVVNMHRVSRWTDDCYLVLGQSQYLKQDFESAEESLEFMTAEFNPKEVAKREAKSNKSKKRKKAVKKGRVSNSGDDGNEKVELSKKEKQKLADKKRKEREKERKQKMKEAKKAKKARKKGKKVAPKKSEDKSTEKKPTKAETEVADEPEVETLPAPGSITLGDLEPDVVQSNPENYFMKHRPAYQEGMLWLARTYIERENYTNAERILNDLERSPGTFDDVRSEAAVAKAHFYLKQKKYDLAVEPLNAAIDLVKDKQMKARLAFILGQIHQKAKRRDAAYAAYAVVLKNQPPYEMDFAARLNLAEASPSNQEAVSQLERMLKEEKNKEYQDQIYFALASIALENGDKKEGIKNLELSLQKSTANISQKAESYLLLADLYFEEESYVKAKLYYDSTLLVMTDADERFRKVTSLAENLEGIAMNLNIISVQDSLLRISNMTEEEQLALATNIRKAENEEKIRKIKEKAAQENGTNAPNIPKGGPAPVNFGNSKFFAYNDRNVKDGKRDFERKWGSRTLQDNWRRADQSSVADENSEIQAAKETKLLSTEEVKAILKDVPDTPEKIAAANREIEAAFFNLGSLFRDRLQNYKKSALSLEELLNRYPETQYKLDAYYYLYLSYRDMGDPANAQRYFDMIVDNYPNSNYARILKDPSFAAEIKAKQDKLTSYYDETLLNFERRDYQSAFDRIEKVPEMFGGQNKLMSRFSLLGAMCVGNLQGKEAYVEALKEVIAKYPADPESTRAKEILRLLGESVGSGPGQQRDLPLADGQVGNYKVSDDQLHMVVVVFNSDVVLNDAKIIVSDYNEKYHKPQKLRMNNIYLGDGEARKPVISIRRFTDKKEAMEYLDTCVKNRKDFLDEKKYQYDVLPISQDNYRELLRSKALDDYKAFFEKNYSK
ncbi:MAG: tetratricopeptide repeat protein [Saprospiraceae bacterium]|nr:tetratricopeptide repeat protein [Saprospiraceae bacterium]MCF8251653.1 tetratricopeptide repeat protein [Saprospiraceae bacterium]MCF8281063.1 tetratricopeptide repeat protein [Bacteroidales bacterium]MCF8313272.1 tetratricopeptide repeat protein [Saprospiraceae bacterium]MCF8442016.1 tetratricopeptide repeat protein [Saprospiraceae bacterium]